MNNTGYYIGEACKNTFVLFDALEQSSVDQFFLAWAYKCLMKEQKDDALILVNGQINKGEYYCKMLVLGQDNTLGEFCGNGSRLCASYLFSKLKEFDHFYLITDTGNILLSKKDEEFATKLTPVVFTINEKFIAAPELFKKEGEFHYIELEDKKFYFGAAIEPHLVLREDVSDDELHDLGRALNNRKDIFPLGININACVEDKPNVLRVKTYERGVQRLTLSCGSGSSTSSAQYLAGKTGSVTVFTPGGMLEITVNDDNVILKGPANVESFVTTS